MFFKNTERRESQYIFIIFNIFSYLQFLVLICSHGLKVSFSIISLLQICSVPTHIFCISINYFTSLYFIGLSDPMDCSLPGSSIHGIFQARVLEWDAIAFSD